MSVNPPRKIGQISMWKLPAAPENTIVSLLIELEKFDWSAILDNKSDSHAR